MSTATLSPAALALITDRIWANTGSIGALILLSGTLYSGTFTVNASTDVITTAAAHGMVTGSRFRVTTTGVLPALSSGSLGTTTDYYAIVTSTTTLKLALTLADAIATTAVNLTDTGSGTHTLSEQRLTDADPVTVLINKELSGSGYTRRDVTGLGAAAVVSTAGEKTPITETYTASGSSLIFRHVLLLRGANTTIGDTTGTEPHLTTESADVTVAVGAPKLVTFILRTRNA